MAADLYRAAVYPVCTIFAGAQGRSGLHTNAAAADWLSDLSPKASIVPESGCICRGMPPRKFVKRISTAPKRHCPHPLGRQPCDPASHSRGVGLRVAVLSAGTRQHTDLSPALPGAQEQQTGPASPLLTYGFTVGRQARRIKNKRAGDNRKRSRAWQVARPHHLQRRIIAEQLSEQRTAAARHSVQIDFNRRCSSAEIFCHTCGSATTACSEQQQQERRTVYVVHLQGTLLVSLPTVVCNCCKKCSIRSQQTSSIFLPRRNSLKNGMTSRCCCWPVRSS